MLSFARESCVFCRICEEVCSFRLTEQVKPSAAAIRIDRDEGRWGLPRARVCNLCEGLGEQKCVASCPEEALSLGPNGVIVWDGEKCTRCDICLDECPQGAVAYDAEGDRLHICDLCGGEPECIKWCPEEAIAL